MTETAPIFPERVYIPGFKPEVRKIAVYPNPVVLKKAERVVVVTDEIRQLIVDMVRTLEVAGGVGLAAPQVGISKRIILAVEPEWPHDSIVMINPEIVERTGTQRIIEGCLSVAGFTSEVERSDRIVMSCLTLDGRPMRVIADGRFSACIQHEIDHLSGVLFIDKLPPVQRTLVRARLRKRAVRRDPVF